MPKKLKLDLNALNVESFVTIKTGLNGGAVACPTENPAYCPATEWLNCTQVEQYCPVKTIYCGPSGYKWTYCSCKDTNCELY